MNLLAPAALGLAALAIPLVALYMLRSRRQKLVVPSVMLWQAAGPSVSSATPWQRLRLSPLLAVQLLILAVFVTLLARPFFEQHTDLGPHSVLVVDTSGSMAMGSRFERTIEEAKRLVADAAPEHLVSIVAAGPAPRVLAAFSAEPDDLRRHLDGLAPGGGTADLGAAIRLGQGLAGVDRPTTVFLLSDGGDAADAPPVPEPAAGVRHLLFDDLGDNVAVTAFSTDAAGEGASRVFLEVSNFGDRAASVTAEILVNSAVTAVLDHELEARGRHSETLPIEAGPGDEVEVRLAGHEDALPLDDSAVLVLGSGRDLAVAVAGEGSVFLDALIAAAPTMVEAGDGPADVAIVDGGDPALAGARPAWLIAPDPPPPGVTATGWIENAVVTWQAPGEPLLDDVDLSDLAIARAQIVDAPGWLPLVRAGDVPLVLLGEVEGRRAVYFTFDLVHSNLPVQVSFPILGARLLGWLGGADGPAAAPAGTPIPVAARDGHETRIVLPGGEDVMLPDGTSLFTDTASPGAYRVFYEDPSGVVTAGPVAVRHFAPAESVGGSRALATVDTPGSASAGTLVREWAPRLLVLLLGLSLAEWWFGHERPGRRLLRRRTA